MPASIHGTPVAPHFHASSDSVVPAPAHPPKAPVELLGPVVGEGADDAQPEVPPGELPAQRLGAVAALAGELLLELEGRDRAEVKGRGEPGRPIEPGQVADVGVVGGVGDRLLHQLAAAPLARARGGGDPLRRGVDPELALARRPADRDAVRRLEPAGARCRLAPGGVQPGAPERREDPERPLALRQDPGRLGTGDPGVADELGTGPGERLGDPAVAAAGVGGVVAVDVDLDGAALRGEQDQLLCGITAAEVQRSTRGAQPLAELPQRREQVGVSVR